MLYLTTLIREFLLLSGCQNVLCFYAECNGWFEYFRLRGVDLCSQCFCRRQGRADTLQKFAQFDLGQSQISPQRSHFFGERIT